VTDIGLYVLLVINDLNFRIEYNVIINTAPSTI